MSKYIIEKADPGRDKKELLPLLQRNLEGISEERFTWNYLKAPVVCLTARDGSSGELVGTCAIFLRDIYVGGKQCRAGIAGDFAVDKKHRTFGPALMIQKALLASLGAERVDFTYSIPNPLSEPLLVRLGYKEIGKYHRYVKLLKAEYRENRNILPSPLKGIASGLTDFTLKTLSKEFRYRRPESVTVETPVSFDGRFDALSAAAGKKLGIVGARDSKFLHWRYKESSYRDYRVFAVTAEKGSLTGYIVYYIDENVAYIADMLCDRDIKNAVKTLLSEFCIQMRKDSVGSVSIRYLGASSVEAQIKGMNFFEDKRNETRVYVFCPPSQTESGFILNSENWYILEGDNDF
ncbi:MAG: GNAT family N-acetyltransferase [Deltaproteobacteria bacterium]|nr:GNAT family N-acetyltransferase [Deltaproteobacteria bacterium]